MAESRHPLDLEPRFRRAVAPRVQRRLDLVVQAGLEEGLAEARCCHRAIHGASAVLGEAIAYQSTVGRLATIKAHLLESVHAAERALEALKDLP